MSHEEASADELTRKVLEPQTVRNDIARCNLSRAETAALNTLLDKVNWRTWKTETKDGEELRLSMRYLGSWCGYSERQFRRGIQSAELRKLVEIDGGVYQPNLYELRVQAIHDLAEERRGKARLRLASSAEDLDQLRVPRVDAGRVRRDARDEAAEAAGLTPDWAIRRAKQAHTTPEAVLNVVQQVVNAVRGPTEEALGIFRRPVLRLWQALHYPPPAVLKEQVRLVVLASDEGCDEEAILKLRGLRKRTVRTANGQMVTWEKKYEDRTHEVKAFGQINDWLPRQDAARRHAEGRCSCRQHAQQQSLVKSEPAELPVAEGRAAPDALVREATARWTAASRALHDAVGDEQWTIWIKPLRFAGVRADVIVLSAPNKIHVSTVQQRFGAQLQEALGGEVCFLEPRSTGPPKRS